jgi:hypothetical protein
MQQPPSLNVGIQSTAGVSSIEDGHDIYTTTTPQENQLPDGSPVVLVRVGRQYQPIGIYFGNITQGE